MSFQGSIYVSTARNSRHLTRAMLAEMVNHETEVLTADQEEMEVWLNGGAQDFDSSMVELADECFDYTNIRVWFEDGQWNTAFNIVFTEYDTFDYTYEPLYDDYPHDHDAFFDKFRSINGY